MIDSSVRPANGSSSAVSVLLGLGCRIVLLRSFRARIVWIMFGLRLDYVSLTIVLGSIEIEDGRIDDVSGHIWTYVDIWRRMGTRG